MRNTYKGFIGLIAALLSITCISNTAWAMTVSPTRLEFTPASATTTLTVINDSTKQAINIRMLSRLWLPDDTLQATDQLVVYPPTATIAAGQQQTFRLMLRGKVSLDTARYFRLLVQNAGDLAAEDGKVRLKTGFSVPVYVEPNGVKPLLSIQRQGQMLTLRNDGGGHELIQRLVLPTGPAMNLGRVLLPGATWQLPLPANIPATAALHLDTKKSGDVAVQ